MKKTLGLIYALLIAAGGALAQPADPAVLRSINQVVEDFRVAIIEKDKPKFMKLFLHEQITWQSVMSDRRLQKARQSRPDAVKAAFDPGNTPLAFIDGIVGNEKSFEETFSDIQINTDGDVASVTFDFVFLYDGSEDNYGKESWLLVRTESGWKIVAVAYSRNGARTAEEKKKSNS